MPTILEPPKGHAPVNSHSVTVSFRLDSALKDELADEAQKKGMSLNAYVGEYLRRCVDWLKLQQEFEHISIPKEALVAFLDKIEESDIATLAHTVLAPRMADFGNLVHGTTDINELCMSMKLSARYQYPTPVACEIRIDDGVTHIFLRHGISQKWSVFLAEGYMAYLERIQLTGSYEATDKSLKITIRQNEARNHAISWQNRRSNQKVNGGELLECTL